MDVQITVDGDVEVIRLVKGLAKVGLSLRTEQGNLRVVPVRPRADDQLLRVIRDIAGGAA